MIGYEKFWKFWIRVLGKHVMNRNRSQKYIVFLSSFRYWIHHGAETRIYKKNTIQIGENDLF